MHIREHESEEPSFFRVMHPLRIGCPLFYYRRLTVSSFSNILVERRSPRFAAVKLRLHIRVYHLASAVNSARRYAFPACNLSCQSLRPDQKR